MDVTFLSVEMYNFELNSHDCRKRKENNSKLIAIYRIEVTRKEIEILFSFRAGIDSERHTDVFRLRPRPICDVSSHLPRSETLLQGSVRSTSKIRERRYSSATDCLR